MGENRAEGELLTDVGQTSKSVQFRHKGVSSALLDRSWLCAEIHY